MLFTLIRNEFRKIVRRPKTQVVFALGIIFTIVMTFSLYHGDKNVRYHMAPETQIKWATESIERIDREIDRINKLDESKKEDSKIELDRLLADRAVEEKAIEKFNGQIKNGISEDEWKLELEENINHIERAIGEIEAEGINEQNQSYYLSLKQDMENNQYLKNNNIKPLESWEFESFNSLKTIIQALGMGILVSLLAVFISDIVSGECTPATLKFLLVQPIKRGQVLLSKYLAATLTSLGMIFVLEGFAFGLVSIFSKLQGWNYPVMIGKLYENKIGVTGINELVLKEGSAYMTTNTELAIKALLFQALFIITACTVIFMISSIMNSSMVTMGVSVITLVFATVSSMTVSSVKKIAHLLFVNYGDTISLVTGDTAAMYNNANMNTNNAILVMIATIIISYTIAHITFNKKDILI